MVHHSNPNPDEEHLVKAELIHKLSPFYDAHPQNLIQKIISTVNPFGGHDHHAIVHTENYKHPELTSFSERQQVRRTVFALKKVY